ncbi:NAD-glutamate dehydrogenase [Acidocella aminolytica]|uniref:NAD-glutamate dehydrogenase n=1 Tax=Acidocella aminolytica TaxID=33998 RepID=UPI0011147DA8|nr:NAD-glutamate dehydrogenase [Acidocella aminolytica]
MSNLYTLRMAKQYLAQRHAFQHRGLTALANKVSSAGATISCFDIVKAATGPSAATDCAALTVAAETFWLC